MEDALALLFFVLFFVGMGWFILSQIRKDRRRKAAVDALAAQRGWRIARRTDGRRPVTDITPPDGAWRLEISNPYRSGAGKNAPSNPGNTEFRSPRPVWMSGRAVVMQRMPGGMERMMGGPESGLSGFLQNSAVKALAGRMLGTGLVADLTELTPVALPSGIELTVLATTPPDGLDWRALHDAIHGWTPVHARDRAPPSARLGPEGFALRLSTPLTEPEDIEKFLDLATDLASRLGDGPQR